MTPRRLVCSTGRCRSVAVALALLLALPGLSACAGRARPLEPLVTGWERNLGLEWDVANRGGRPIVSGYLTNGSPYTLARVQLLVEALDANGASVAQEVTDVAADMITPSTRAYFEVRAQATPSITYRVRVFAFDPVTGCGD